MKVVINSSPIIFLSKLGFLEIFVDSTDDLFFVPVGVREEILQGDDLSSQVMEGLISEGRLVVKSCGLFSLVRQLSERLGKGESEAIALGVELQSDYAILDDLAARKEAKRMGLEIRGTLAVIKRLIDTEKIKVHSYDELYQEITGINFRVSRRIFNAIFK